MPENTAPPEANPLKPGADTQDGFLKMAESWAAMLALAGLVALRIAYAFVYRVDSDEPQHLHVVWGWSHGMLPYRDLFDNHSPLFQMLCSPLMRVLGEHAWIVVPMRLAMLPLYLADLWLIYLIGSALYSRRWGVWMALIAGSVPIFFLTSTEFRPDDLWTLLWLTTVWLAVSGPMRGRRAFLFGLTIGACFGVSMKTSLLLAAIGAGATGLLVLDFLSPSKPKLGTMVKPAAVMLAGLIIVPALLTGFFAAHGALHQMVYCVFRHNAAPGLGKWRKPGFHLLLFPLSAPVLLGLGRLYSLSAGADKRKGAGRALILMTCGAYYFLLRGYCPLVTAQDYLPILPLVVLTVMPLIFRSLTLMGGPRQMMIPALGMLCLLCDGAFIWKSQSPRDNEMAVFEEGLAISLRLTNPDDLVMDGKGETIFRNRPTYWVFEGATLRRIELGLIPDDVKEKMIQTHTCVAVNHRLRPDDRKWLEANFLEGESKIWVAGKSLGSAHAKMAFHTDIGGTYSIVSDSGTLTGNIDGTPLAEFEEIPPGDHRLKIATGSGNIALVWTQALDRGFNPFTGKVSGMPQ
jgi:hypothetical protein